MTEQPLIARFCPLCNSNYLGAHKCQPVEDVIVDCIDPNSGERFSTWATMANKDWTK